MLRILNKYFSQWKIFCAGGGWSIFMGNILEYSIGKKNGISSCLANHGDYLSCFFLLFLLPTNNLPTSRLLVGT
jgi:hypothetical protein